MFAFEAVAVSLAMPSVARELDGETLYPIAVVGMLTAAIVGMVVGGIWSDARGASLPLTVGGVGFVAGLLVSGFAGSMEIFVGGRLLQGLGCGAALTAMYVAVGDAYPAHLRTRVFSLFATAWVVPSIAGPFVAGALVDLFGWRSVFLVVAGFAALQHLRGTRPDGSATGRPRGTTGVGPSPGVRRDRRRRGGRAAPRRPRLRSALRASARRRSAGRGVASGPLLPRGTTSARRGLPAVIASRGLFGAAFACVEMFLPPVLQNESGMSPTLSGLVMMVGALGWVAGSAYAGKHARPETFPRILRVGEPRPPRRHRRLLALVPVDHSPIAAGIVATIGFTIMAVGMGLATPLMSTLALDLAPEGRQGDSGAAIQMSDSLGQSIAAGLVGAVFARWFLIDAHTSYLAGFGLALAARPSRW